MKLHICGNTMHLLPSISELDVDILDIDYQVRMDEAYAILGTEVIRCVKVNPVLVEERKSVEI